MLAVLSFTLLFFSLLEGSIIELPIVLVLLICLASQRKDAHVFFLAFISGLILDILLLRTPGATSMFFVTVTFLLMLYQRKFEIASYYFVAFASFFASIFYSLIFHVSYTFLQATMSVILAILFFLLLRMVSKMHEKPLVV